MFERIIISYGSGMDPLTGKFTSPVDGVYMFYFSGTAISSTYLQVNSFYKNYFEVFQNSIYFLKLFENYCKYRRMDYFIGVYHEINNRSAKLFTTKKIPEH